MEISEIFGLPAHPLLVHGAVVLLPLAAIGTIIVALVPRARRHYAPIALILAVLATVSVALAQGSGEQLEERVAKTELVKDHANEGERVLPWAIGLTLAAAAVTSLDPLSRRNPDSKFVGRPVMLSIVAFTVLASVGATLVVADVGHSGAKAAWSDVVASPGDGDGD